MNVTGATFGLVDTMRMSRAGQPWAPEEVAILVQAASRAPSIHNTQPWRFSAVGKTVEVWADRRRALAVADPQGR